VAEVLIIEDDDRIRPLLVRGLRECGHTVTSAPTGMGGLQLAVDSRPDLVVLDLGLPDVDGTQVLSMLRAVSQVPVIIASARADDPSLVNSAPFEGGWLFKVRITGEPDDLLSADEYTAYTAG
jgi:DNA-binding response OmpR family regulator